MRELPENLVTKQSIVDRLTHELAERYTEVERLLVDLANNSREIGHLTQEIDEKGAQIDRLSIESAGKSGTPPRTEMQTRFFIAELTEKDLVRTKEMARMSARSHGTQDTARTQTPERE